jgi:GcrA cell cycle regulator
MMWTMEQDDRLRAMHAEKPRLTCAEMGERMGRSKNAIIGRRGRIGLAGAKRVAKPRNRSPNRSKAEPQISKRRMAMLLKAEPLLRDVPSTAPIGAKSLLDLAPGECRWPFGDKPYTFCGRQAAAGSYCAGHARIAYRPGVMSAPERAQARMSRLGHWAARAG